MSPSLKFGAMLAVLLAAITVGYLMEPGAATVHETAAAPPPAQGAGSVAPTLASPASLSTESTEERDRSLLAQKWLYSEHTDAMTSKPTRHAIIRSENAVSFDFPYQGLQHATLTLRDHPTYGKDVFLSIERGQILCQSYQDCSLRIRFDEASPSQWAAVGPADNGTTTAFIRGYSRFLANLRRSSMVRIQVPVYQEGEPVFEFEVGGFDLGRYQPASPPKAR
jgi:hypothetical protein